jgi:hypothetical protein
MLVHYPRRERRKTEELDQLCKKCDRDIKNLRQSGRERGRDRGSVALSGIIIS